ncbi:hypothetical protein K437DRAFT_94043 [Tilletiaria anomala UBC 951]|uniref:Uncharacterized protein n=1 Tax=Tilletiaria anomala (strain ATCC 24038 / CBS 436.72 / UBC 951) TaxID=1037660 RepID=A0A066W900_TILAU|nr:uncharacterized protein K437DRAFT_94043 [Tilletiaria anomala UBC 951]KDN47559.1 hypothetical protein K437DRAFT_94043 [Tilletiaria anomala UBC 951]
MVIITSQRSQSPLPISASSDLVCQGSIVAKGGTSLFGETMSGSRSSANGQGLRGSAGTNFSSFTFPPGRRKSPPVAAKESEKAWEQDQMQRHSNGDVGQKSIQPSSERGKELDDAADVTITADPARRPCEEEDGELTYATDQEAVLSKNSSTVQLTCLTAASPSVPAAVVLPGIQNLLNSADNAPLPPFSSLRQHHHHAQGAHSWSSGHERSNSHSPTTSAGSSSSVGVDAASSTKENQLQVEPGTVLTAAAQLLHTAGAGGAGSVGSSSRKSRRGQAYPPSARMHNEFVFPGRSQRELPTVSSNVVASSGLAVADVVLMQRRFASESPNLPTLPPSMLPGSAASAPGAGSWSADQGPLPLPAILRSPQLQQRQPQPSSVRPHRRTGRRPSSLGSAEISDAAAPIFGTPGASASFPRRRHISDECQRTRPNLPAEMTGINLPPLVPSNGSSIVSSGIGSPQAHRSSSLRGHRSTGSAAFTGCFNRPGIVRQPPAPHTWGARQRFVVS